MSPNSQLSHISREAVTEQIFEMLQSVMPDRDMALTPEMALCDSGLDSVCIAYMIGELQQHYRLGGQLYKTLVDAGVPIPAMTVSHLIDCLCRTLWERGGERGGI